MKNTIKCGMGTPTEPQSGEGSPLAAASSNAWSLQRKLRETKSAWMRILFPIALVAMIGFSMAACNDDDSGDKDPPIVGSWGNNSQQVWTFNKNGTATFVTPGIDVPTTINYTYSIDGTTLTTINTANDYTETWNFSISGSTLTMTRITPSAGAAQTFTKQ